MTIVKGLVLNQPGAHQSVLRVDSCRELAKVLLAYVGTASDLGELLEILITALYDTDDKCHSFANKEWGICLESTDIPLAEKSKPTRLRRLHNNRIALSGFQWATGATRVDVGTWGRN